jgi:2-oxoisovalerate dehydrogenase E1 component
MAYDLIHFDRTGFSDDLLINLYTQLLKPRMIEEKMLLLLRQGKISKWFSGIGQEAISVGCTAALDSDEKIFSMHRNLGVFTSRNVPLDRLFCQWQGKKHGFSKGRERSFHFGIPKYNIIGMISHLGPQLSFSAGVALSYKLSGLKKISLAFTGEGGTSQGEFHEALNTAAVWKIPVIFVIENNGYGLSTPTNEQYVCENLADRAHGYGMKSSIIEGNNILEVYKTIKEISKLIKDNPQPWLVECRTFRMRGHEEASGTKYVPQHLFDLWEKKDPLSTYESFLIDEGLLDKNKIENFRFTIKTEIDEAVEVMFSEPEIESTESNELNDVYAPYSHKQVTPQQETKEMRFIDAISDGLNEAMKKHNNLILMGQDIAEYGGVFKITQNMVEKYGKERVRNTPLCESAIVGIALGLSLQGYKSMVEMQFADFVTCAFNQIVNNLAKIHYRWTANADVVIRMPAGGGVGAGPFHSQTNEAWFIHTPGLKVLYPSNPIDAKGLLISSFEDPNPIIFFEHKALYRQLTDNVPVGYYNLEIGKASFIKKGTDFSIITYGLGVLWAKKYTENSTYDIEILDLRTLLPLDFDAIDQTVKNTGRVLLLHEDTLIGGIGGEISAYISEKLFTHLDAPIVRVASLDTPVPFATPLEQQFMANHRLDAGVKKLMSF